jgi:hypothetical protein
MKVFTCNSQWTLLSIGALQIVPVIPEPRSSEVCLAQLVTLDQRAHASIEHGDPAFEQTGEGGGRQRRAWSDGHGPKPRIVSYLTASFVSSYLNAMI